MTDVNAAEIAVYLDLWRAAGVADGYAETGTDWFAKTIPPAASPPKAAPARVSQMTAVAAPQRTAPPVVSAHTVRPAANATVIAAASLDDLRSQLEAFTGCGLKATAKSLCFYRGQAQARLMLIGEAPGRDEDLAGKPFVGRAGQLLDKMLATIGISEENAHITNTVYWRPPGNRTPAPEEMAACAPFLARQIALVDPEIVLLVGGVAAKQVLGVSEGITKLRGTWREMSFDGRNRRVLATLHPSYLLRTPAAKGQAWQDLMKIQAALQI